MVLFWRVATGKSAARDHKSEGGASRWLMLVDEVVAIRPSGFGSFRRIFSPRDSIFDRTRTVPQRLKPGSGSNFMARLKPCPSFKICLSHRLLIPSSSSVDSKAVSGNCKSLGFGPNDTGASGLG
jgi:hypothetical protein